MIKFLYPDGSHCYRALHTAHAVFTDDEGRLMARTQRPDSPDLYEFEIVAFELIGPGRYT